MNFQIIVSIDDLNQDVYIFYVYDLEIILWKYEKQYRQSKRHKWVTKNMYLKNNMRDSTIKQVVIPEEVKRQVISKLVFK